MARSTSATRSPLGDSSAERGDYGGAGVPGKRTLTAQLAAPRQAKAASGGGSGPAAAQGAGAGGGAVADPFALHLGGSCGGGDRLPDELRARMERSFAADFSSVRVHHGAHVAAMGALAYAQGEELHFAPGQYDPHSASGQELIGHELAHVLQQRAGRVTRDDAQGKGGASAGLSSDAGLEAEADAMGARAARGEAAGSSAGNASGNSAPSAAARGVRQAKPSSNGLMPDLGGGHDNEDEREGEGEDEDILEIVEDGEANQLVTANQQLMQQALELMPSPVRRFVLSLQISREQGAMILQLRTEVLAHILTGLIALPVTLQRQLSTFQPLQVRELFLDLASRPMSSWILALPPPPKQSAGPRQVVNDKSGEWEYFFSYEQSEFPDIDPRDGGYRDDGYRYELLRYDEKGAYFRRAKRSGGLSRGRDFHKEKLLSRLFETLVREMGKSLPAGKGDFAAVAQLIQYGQLGGETLLETADRIFTFFQGMFLDAYAKAKEEAVKSQLEKGWAKLCSFLDERKELLSGFEFRPVPSLAEASPELLDEHRSLRARTVAPSFGVEVEGEEGSVLVHRSDADIEILDGVAYVRVYQTVYAPCFNGSFKDIKQLESGQVIIEAVGGKSWMNMGWPLRAFHYVKTYAAQGVIKGKEARDKLEKEKATKYKGKDGEFQVEMQKVELNHGLPIVRTFLVPKDFHDEYTESSISENQVEKLGSNHTLNVDKSKAPNQYGVRARDVRLFQERALPFSLVSFVADGEEDRYKDPQHGTVKPLSGLAKFLRMPSSNNPFVPRMKGTHVESAEVQRQHAETLGHLYDLTCQIEKLQGEESGDESELAQLIDLWDALALPYGVSFPKKGGQLAALKDSIERAATFALVPSLIDQNYEDMCLRMRNVGKRESGHDIDPFVELQNVRLIEHPSIKDDEEAPSMVKREHAEGRVGETCNAMIEILILCFNDPDMYFFKAEAIRTALAHLLFSMTREKLCGEDPTRLEVVELLKTVLLERVCQGVRSMLGEPPKRQKNQESDELDLERGEYSARQQMMSLCLGHFIGLVQGTKVPVALENHETVSRELVMARAEEVTQALRNTMVLVASLLKGGASKELTTAFETISLFLDEEHLLPSMSAAQDHLVKLNALLRTCQAMPKSFHSAGDREVRNWMKRVVGDVERLLLPPKEKSKGGKALETGKKSKGGSGGDSQKIEAPPLELLLQAPGHGDLLDEKQMGDVVAQFSEELLRFGLDLGEALGNSFVEALWRRTSSQGGLVEGYVIWLAKRTPSSSLQEQYLAWFLREMFSLYQQFKLLAKARTTGSTKPFEIEEDETPPDYSPFTGVYDRALKKGGGSLGPKISSIDHEEGSSSSDGDEESSGGLGLLKKGTKVRFEYLIGKAHVLGTIVSGPNPKGEYQVAMSGAVHPGGLVRYTHVHMPNELDSLDYMNGTVFGTIPGSSFLKYEDGSKL